MGTFNADPITITTSLQGVLSNSKPPVANPFLDIIWNCAGIDRNGNRDKGVIELTFAPTFDLLNATIAENTAITITMSVIGTESPATVFNSDTVIDLTLGLNIYDTYVIPVQTSWVWNSKIGSLDFTLDRTNEAGRRPMPFTGSLYAIKKLGNEAVVYGASGVAVMTPNGLNWGVRHVLKVGLIGKLAVCGDEGTHYFIDNQGQLWTLTSQGFDVKDYSNQLSGLSSSTVMSYDVRKRIVYICDGTYGFVYTSSGLGKGPVNISGLGLNGSTFYSAAPATITTLPFNVTTDTFDLGNRKEKTITQIDLGLNNATDVYVAINYRWNKAQSFSTTPWVKTDYHGRAFIICSGVEFQLKVKQDTYSSLQVDSAAALVKTKGQA